MEATIVCEGQKYTGRVFSSMYLDWGFEILRNGESIFYNPHFLGSECYGYNHPDVWEEEEGIEGSEWTAGEWKSAIMDLLEDMAPGFEYDGEWNND